MNKDRIVKAMISYIEEEERNLQAAKMANDVRAGRTDIVNGILGKLEKEISDENQDD